MVVNLARVRIKIFYLKNEKHSNNNSALKELICGAGARFDFILTHDQK